MNTTERLSVVVIGRNEGARLERCLRSIQAMHAPLPFEVIYVDSASTDGSPERAAALGARVLRVVPERPSAATGRNAGWRAADSDWILFLDGDTVLDADFLTRALATARTDPQIAVVWGHRREMYPQQSLYNRVLDLDWIYPPGDSEFCGGDALMRRTALAAVEGFDASLIAGEEPELCQRLRARGGRIVHIDAPMTGHDLAMTRFSQYWRRAVRAGHAYAEVEHRLRDTATPLWREDVQRNRRRGPLILGLLAGGPLLALLFKSLWPLLICWGVFAALVARSYRRSAWKGGDRLTRWLYAVHSHVQQIPILLGQLSYWRNRRRGQRQRLIEYK